VVNVPV